MAKRYKDKEEKKYNETEKKVKKTSKNSKDNKTKKEKNANKETKNNKNDKKENIKKDKNSKNNKNNKKKKYSKVFIITILSVIVVAIFAIWIYCIINSANKDKINNDGKEQVAVSEELLKDKEFKGMKIKSIDLENKEQASYFKCNIENTSDDKYDGEDVYFVFTKKDDLELAKFKYHIDEIEKDEIKDINITTTNVLTDAYNFYIESIDENKDNIIVVDE